jgi:hypothetical protein
VSSFHLTCLSFPNDHPGLQKGDELHLAGLGIFHFCGSSTSAAVVVMAIDSEMAAAGEHLVGASNSPTGRENITSAVSLDAINIQVLLFQSSAGVVDQTPSLEG